MLEELFPLLVLHTFHFYQTSQCGKKNLMFKKLLMGDFFLKKSALLQFNLNSGNTDDQNSCLYTHTPLLSNKSLCFRSVWLPQPLHSEIYFSASQGIFSPLKGAKCLNVGGCVCFVYFGDEFLHNNDQTCSHQHLNKDKFPWPTKCEDVVSGSWEMKQWILG